MKRKARAGCLYVCLLLLGLSTVGGARGDTPFGLTTAAPPLTLGGYTMTPFGTDPSALDSLLSGLAGPLGGTLTFSTPVRHDNVANGWATWSHGYQGDVYDSTADIDTLLLGLPVGTTAFYFYAEPNQWAKFNITAVTDDGSFINHSAVDGNGGAYGFGFVAQPGTTLSSITVSTSDLDFSIGEFGIATGSPQAPEVGCTLAYLLAGLLGLGGTRFYARIRK